MPVRAGGWTVETTVDGSVLAERAQGRERAFRLAERVADPPVTAFAARRVPARREYLSRARDVYVGSTVCALCIALLYLSDSDALERALA